MISNDFFTGQKSFFLNHYNSASCLFHDDIYFSANTPCRDITLTESSIHTHIVLPDIMYFQKKTHSIGILYLVSGVYLENYNFILVRHYYTFSNKYVLGG